LTSGIALGTYSTVQLTTTIDTAVQATGNNRFLCLFGKGTTNTNIDELNVFLRNVAGTTDTVFHAFDGYAAANTSRPQFPGWKGRYLTFILGEQGANRVRITQTPDYGTSYERMQFNAYPSYQLSWAGVPGESLRWVKGTYHSVRIYNRCLEESEIAWNYLVDEVRFRGVITNGCVFVRSSIEGIGATNELYFVNGTGTLSAPASVTANGTEYIPSGYTLEQYNPESGTWEEKGTFEGSSYMTTRCAEICGERITWNWRIADTQPMTVRWTGLGDKSNLLDSQNWNGYNVDGDFLGNVVPQRYSTVIVEGTTTFGIPEGTTEFPWHRVQFGKSITLAADCDWRALGSIEIPAETVIDTEGYTLKVAAISAIDGSATVTNTVEEKMGTLEVCVKENETFVNSSIDISGNMHVRKTGLGKFVSNRAQNYCGNTYILEGTAQPPDETGTSLNYSGTGFGSTIDWDDAAKLYKSKIIVSNGAVFDIRAGYAWRSKIVLDGGTLANTCADMIKNTWGGSGVGALTADSNLDVSCTIVFGDDNGKGDTNLGGYTLRAKIAESRALYLRCSYITNGVLAVTGTGTIGNNTATTMTDATLDLGTAINMSSPLTVKNYIARYEGNNFYNTSRLTVTGVFKPVSGCFFGPYLTDGAAIDFSEVKNFPLVNQSSSGHNNKNITFAEGEISIGIKIGKTRAEFHKIANESPYLLMWGQKVVRQANAKFVFSDKPDISKEFVLKQDEIGLKVVYVGGMSIKVR
jgi:hypothetical protein